MFRIYRILFLLSFLFPSIQSIAQGCSDAGICTIRSFKPGMQVTQDISTIVNLGVALGGADHGIFVVNPYFSASSRLSSSFSYDYKINAQLNTGNNISNIGLGDGYVNLNYHPTLSWTITAGLKAPLGKDDEEEDGKPLPLDYQTTLGTFDLLGGIGYKNNNWQFVLGYQHPLGNSDNQFTPEAWVGDTLFSTFQNTNEFNRQPDIILRIARSLQLSDKMNFTPGILGIYHLGEDEYLVPGEGYKPIIGSDGLTINASLFVDLKLNDHSGIGVSAGFPLLVREVRPDGLTRSFVFAVEYQHYFF